jgi:hypothetical protein
MGSPTEPRGSSLLARLRRPRAVWFVPVLALLALLAWVFASPVGSSPDDDFHLTSTWCANPSNAACLPGHDANSRVVPRALVDAPCFAHDRDTSAACQLREFTFDAKPSVETTRGNFGGEYPPVYYAAMSVFAGSNIVLCVILMRIFTVLLFLGITIALYVLLPLSRRPTLVWSWVITTIPLGIFLLTSNNPSSWAIIGLGSAWLALLGYFETKGKRRIALGALFALSVVMAAGSRADAAFYSVVAIGVVIWLTFIPQRTYLLQAILPAAMIIVSVLFFATSNQSGAGLHGFDSAASGNTGGPVATTSPAPSAVSLLAYNVLNIPSLWAGVFGNWGLGWLDTPLPAVVTFGATAVFVAVAFVGLSRVWWRKLIVAAGLTLVLWAVPVFVLGQGHEGVGTDVQPRYLLPLIVLLGGVLVLTRSDRQLAFTRVQLILVVATLAVVNLVALHVNIQRYVVGNNSSSLDLDAKIQWWWAMPLSPDAVWIVGSLAYAAMLVLVVREISRRQPLPITR